MTAEAFINEWLNGAEAIEAHTSGSTGNPKPVMLSRALVIDSARRSIDFFGLNSESHLHLCLPADYIAGKMVIVRALESGARLTVEPPSSAVLTHVDTTDRITLLSVVAAQLQGISELRSRPQIKHLLIGGAPLTKPQARLALQIAENVWESYGMTETASHVALRRISEPEDIIAVPFRLLHGISARLDDRSCLILTLPGGTDLITNDVADMAEDGSFYLKGRYDNVIITGALKVHPEMVEKKIRDIIPVENFYITSAKDPKWGERVVLMLESEQPVDTSMLHQSLKAVLPKHEVPKEIICMQKFNRTITGKIVRTKY